MRCAAITRAGERCKLDATSGSYCWSHAPENAEQRKAKAKRGGKARGTGEVGEIKRHIRTVIAGVLSGQVERGAAAVALQGYNVILRALKLELDIREQEELAERIAALEEASEETKGGRRWGA